MTGLEIRHSSPADIEQIRSIYAEPSSYSGTLQLPYPSQSLREVDMSDKWLALRRLELEVYTDNLPAINLYRKFGFVIEGTMRQYAFRDGGWVDAHVMARINF